jgi:hypothetical protein
MWVVLLLGLQPFAQQSVNISPKPVNLSTTPGEISPDLAKATVPLSLFYAAPTWALEDFTTQVNGGDLGESIARLSTSLELSNPLKLIFP